MRIALYENLPSGGAKRAAFEYARTLTEHGHEVDLWSTTAADADFLPMRRVTSRQFLYPCPRSLVRERPVPIAYPYMLIAEEANRLNRFAQISRRMASDIDRAGYDFVFVHQCQVVQAPYLLRFLRTPSIFYCQEPMRHFYDPHIIRSYQGATQWKDRLGRYWYVLPDSILSNAVKQVDRTNIRRAVVLLANSYYSSESIYRAYDRRALVAYLGVDADSFKPLHLPRQDFVLSVGSVDAHKGYDFLIDALGHLPIEERPALLIVANAVYKQEFGFLQKLAAQRKVSLDIRHSVSHTHLVELYNQTRAFVYAPVLEPFGFAPLEAMACGTPVAAVAEAGVRETVQDGRTGLLTQRDPRLFASVLRQLLADPALQSRLGAAGNAYVRANWTWSAAYDRLMHLVQSTVLRPVSEGDSTLSISQGSRSVSA